MDFFEDGTENGGMLYNKAERFLMLEELYAQVDVFAARREALLDELTALEDALASSRAQLHALEALGR